MAPERQKLRLLKRSLLPTIPGVIPAFIAATPQATRLVCNCEREKQPIGSKMYFGPRTGQVPTPLIKLAVVSICVKHISSSGGMCLLGLERSIPNVINNLIIEMWISEDG